MKIIRWWLFFLLIFSLMDLSVADPSSKNDKIKSIHSSKVSKNNKTTLKKHHNKLKHKKIYSKHVIKKDNKQRHLKARRISKKKIVSKSVIGKVKKQRVVRKFSNTKLALVGTSQFFGTEGLNKNINHLISRDGKNAILGVYVKSLEKDDILYSHNINQALIPASTLKLFTAEAALLYLGTDYRFETQLLTNANKITNGVLQGDLYFVLSGDPSLTYADLTELMQELQNRGVRAISGNVYIDNTAYDQSFYGPGWNKEDRGYCYGAPISASIINQNCLTFGVKPADKVGNLTKVVKASNTFYPQINNAATTRKRSMRCSLRVAKGDNGELDLEGCVPSGSRNWGVNYVVTDVPEYNRKLFKSLLREAGIIVYGTTTFGSTKQKLILLDSHASKPLHELVHDMLKKSDNIIAGALFKKLGQIYTNQSGSWENGGYAVSNILREFAGLKTTGIRLLDGSGLSADNLVTPLQLMQVLQHAYKNKKIYDHFINALPIAGVDGTLKNRLSNIARKVQAKTGTISGVVSLAGYAQGANKEPLAFVIIVNSSKQSNWQYRLLEDKIVTLLTQFKR